MSRVLRSSLSCEFSFTEERRIFSVFYCKSTSRSMKCFVVSKNLSYQCFNKMCHPNCAKRLPILVQSFEFIMFCLQKKIKEKNDWLDARTRCRPTSRGTTCQNENMQMIMSLSNDFLCNAFEQCAILFFVVYATHSILSLSLIFSTYVGCFGTDGGGR